MPVPASDWLLRSDAYARPLQQQAMAQEGRAFSELGRNLMVGAGQIAAQAQQQRQFDASLEERARQFDTGLGERQRQFDLQHDLAERAQGFSQEAARFKAALELQEQQERSLLNGMEAVEASLRREEISARLNFLYGHVGLKQQKATLREMEARADLVRAQVRDYESRIKERDEGRARGARGLPSSYLRDSAWAGMLGPKGKPLYPEFTPGGEIRLEETDDPQKLKDIERRLAQRELRARMEQLSKLDPPEPGLMEGEDPFVYEQQKLLYRLMQDPDLTREKVRKALKRFDARSRGTVVDLDPTATLRYGQTVLDVLNSDKIAASTKNSSHVRKLIRKHGETRVVAVISSLIGEFLSRRPEIAERVTPGDERSLVTRFLTGFSKSHADMVDQVLSNSAGR